MDCIQLGSPDYPQLLTQISDPPPRLWLRGRVDLLRNTCVAVIGARSASQDGLVAAGEIGLGLALAGVAVVSGLARGVDAAAHQGALDAGGATIAVLGTGIDRVYPPEHRDLSERIAIEGLLLTEFPPGSAPEDWHFPRRNRIISGLSKAVVVVEAKEESGSLITARLAAAPGRDVMAVPGTFVGGRNRGANALLRDGAKLVESAVDILHELGIQASLTCPGTESQRPQVIEFTVDDIAAQLQIPPGEALARLMEWELTGEIQRIGSGRFTRSRVKL